MSWAAFLTIEGGLFQVLGVLFATRALVSTKALLEERVAAQRPRNPYVPPGPAQRARPNLPSDLPGPRDMGRAIQVLEQQVQQNANAIVQVEQKAWTTTQELDRFVGELSNPRRYAYASGITIVLGVALTVVGGLI